MTENKNHKPLDENNTMRQEETDCTCHDCDCHEKEPCKDTNCNCEDDKQTMQEKEEKVEYYLLLAQRVQAEFDNYRKRTIADMTRVRQDGMIAALETIFPALESFKKASDMIKDEATLSGIALIQKELLSALKKIDVVPIEAKGKPFDPNFHNAIAMIPSTEFEDNMVIEEAQTGYKLGEKVIRYSQVIVARNQNN